ncbi:hypothetical protein ACJRO7_034507 [Eucalyptus globulus]|uniref:Uncharacterized protein n=1 Tax=Eucalyptus globulus TaxID=34317 RepID=A0ABD3J6U1_EUCGL
MVQNKVLLPFFLLLAVCLKLESTEAGKLRLLQKQNPFPNKLQHVNEVLERKPRKTIAEQSKKLHPETSNEAPSTDASSTPPRPPSPMVRATTTPPSPGRSSDAFKPSDPGSSPGFGHSLQN